MNVEDSALEQTVLGNKVFVYSPLPWFAKKWWSWSFLFDAKVLKLRMYIFWLTKSFHEQNFTFIFLFCTVRNSTHKNLPILGHVQLFLLSDICFLNMVI